jgi:alpha-glucosidase
VDLVPNHTSDAHPWFTAAVAGGPGSHERSRYIFRDGRGPHGELPPNDWRSVFGGPAWTQVTDGPMGGVAGSGKAQWYLHLFDPGQPDLNWDNPVVHAEFEDVLRFWLDRGVDGFRVDVAHGLVKKAELPDWHYPPAPRTGPPPADHRPPMWDQDGVHEIYRSWRRILAEYGEDRILVAEAWVQPAERLAQYVRPDEMHQAFNFEYLQASWDVPTQRNVITRSLAATDLVGAPTTWVLSNHDVVRHASRLGLDVSLILHKGIGAADPQPDRALGLRRARAATLLMLALPGSAYLYQGEELGLPEHTTLPDEARQDPGWRRSNFTAPGRDGCRVPIPWQADAPSYGFSHARWLDGKLSGPTGNSWLPQPADWAPYALDRQRGVPGSTYEMYRTALRLRRDLGLGGGSLSWVDSDLDTGLAEEVLAFRNGGTLVLTNFGAEPVSLSSLLPGEPKVLLASADLDDDGKVPTDVTVWVTG